MAVPLITVDGILDEFGDYPVKMLTSGILGLAMPVLAWDHCGGRVSLQKNALSCSTDHSSMDAFFGQVRASHCIHAPLGSP